MLCLMLCQVLHWIISFKVCEFFSSVPDTQQMFDKCSYKSHISYLILATLSSTHEILPPTPPLPLLDKPQLEQSSQNSGFEIRLHGFRSATS